jgi:P27 family predicted phage terminase small subunit
MSIETMPAGIFMPTKPDRRAATNVSQTITRHFVSGLPASPSRAPNHLSRGAKRWWRAIVESYDLEPHHVEILTAAAEAWDRKEEARRLIAEEGLVIRNRSSVPMPHPAVQIEDAAAIRMAHLIRQIGLDAVPAEDVRLP